MNIAYAISKIKSACAEKKYSMNELLRAADLSAHLINDWDSGKSEPSLSALTDICKVLDMNIKDLFLSDELSLTQSQSNLLSEWKHLSEAEKSAIYTYIKAMKSCRR